MSVRLGGWMLIEGWWREFEERSEVASDDSLIVLISFNTKAGRSLCTGTSHGFLGRDWWWESGVRTGRLDCLFVKVTLFLSCERTSRELLNLLAKHLHVVDLGKRQTKNINERS
jgi:hypothetical protein